MTGTNAINAREVAGILDEVGRLRVEARALVEAVLQGTHASPNRGESILFREHAEYLIGDDPRRIDWRASARRTRPVVKRFEQEARLTASLVLDVSRSMFFEGGGRWSKAYYGALLAAATAELLERQGDRFRLLLLSDTSLDYLDARSGRQQLDRLYAALGRALEQQATPKSAQTDTRSVLERLAAFGQLIGRRRGLIICISDFISPADAIIDWSGGLASIGHAVTALQLLSPAELTLPHEGPHQFFNPEGDLSVACDPRLARPLYLDALGAWRNELALLSSKRSVAWTSTSTNTPPAELLRRVVLRQVNQ